MISINDIIDEAVKADDVIKFYERINQYFKENFSKKKSEVTVEELSHSILLGMEKPIQKIAKIIGCIEDK